jgi:chromosome segregation ATPase
LEPLGIVVLAVATGGVAGFGVGYSAGFGRRWTRSARAAADREVEEVTAMLDIADLERRVVQLHTNLREEQAALAQVLQTVQKAQDEAFDSQRDLQREIQEIKTFVVETAQAAAAQRQQEAEREAFIQEAALMEQRRQMATVRQEILEQLSAEMENQRLAEEKAKLAAAQQRLGPVAPQFREEPASFDPERLFGLQQEFVARRRAAQGAEYAGPKGTPVTPDQSQPGL